MKRGDPFDALAIAIRARFRDLSGWPCRYVDCQKSDDGNAKAPQMQRTMFVCQVCNQTRSYTLSMEMAAAYAEICGPAATI